MSVAPAVAGLVERLTAIDGVLGVVLGGSRATGTALPESDTDLGLYYDADALDLDTLGALVARHGGELAGPGRWGPWVDGGAWLTVEGAPVDVLLRDVERVREQCDRARAGEYAFHVQGGHPLGFLDVAYAGEVAVGVPLADASGLIAELRALVTPYPPALRDAMVDGIWLADFTLDAAAKGARRSDAAYVALSVSIAAMLVAHAWFAVAGVWAINEKGLVPRVAGLDVDSGGFAEIATVVCARPGSTPAELSASIERLRAAPRPVSRAGRPRRAGRRCGGADRRRPPPADPPSPSTRTRRSSP